jgi:hypothetical protein
MEGNLFSKCGPHRKKNKVAPIAYPYQGMSLAPLDFGEGE